MAKKTIIISDLTGKEVEIHAVVTIYTEGALFELDADRSEVEKWISSARPILKRGRKPKQ